MRASSRQPGRLGADERRVLLHEMTAFPVVSALISEYISDLRLELRIRLYVRESSCRVRLAALVCCKSYLSPRSNASHLCLALPTGPQHTTTQTTRMHLLTMNIIAK